MKREWGTKVVPLCKQCSRCGLWIGTSRDKVMLISEEIKSVALAVLELYMSEYISKSVGRSVSRQIH